MKSEMKRITKEFSRFPEVEAIVLGGSQSVGKALSGSDWDLYLYIKKEIPLQKRLAVVQNYSSHFELNNRFWEPGDEFLVSQTGETLDLMYRSFAWIEEQLTRVVDRCEAGVGYTTCFWYNVLHSQVLYDPRKKFANLQKKYTRPYPLDLKMNILKKNHPILRDNISSYYQQIEKAIKRKDPVSINHRVSALLASYFDILFAINELPHPGEKRLLTYLELNAQVRPKHMKREVLQVLRGSCLPAKDLCRSLDQLLDHLDECLEKQGDINYLLL